MILSYLLLVPDEMMHFFKLKNMDEIEITRVDGQVVPYFWQ